MSCSRQNPGIAAACSGGMTPGNFSRSVVERDDERFRPEIRCRSALMSLGFPVGIKREIPEARTLCRIHIKKLCLRIEAGRHPIRGAACVGFDQSAVELRFLGRIGDGASLGINAFSPIRLYELRGNEVLSCRAVQDKEIAVTTGLR